MSRTGYNSPIPSSKNKERKRSRSSPPATRSDSTAAAAKYAAAKHAKRLRNWFLHLTPEERGRVLSFEDKEGNALLRHMYQRQSQEGDGLFFDVGEPLFAPTEKLKKFAPPAKPHFCFRKLISLSNFCFYPERLLHADKTLEKSIRLCDTREYLDTITVASNLLIDGHKFLQLMNTVTRGNFLTSPCKVSWDPASKSWVWDEPKWFEGMGYYSLGTWVAHKIEKALWMRYWDSQNLDPRTKPGPCKYTFPNYLEGLLSKTYLINFWQPRTPKERRKIVGSLADLVLHVISNIPDKDKKAAKVKTNPNPDYTQLLSSLVDLSVQERSLELLFADSDLAQNEKTFIEILYFSPLDRAGATIDMVLRRVGMSIQSAYADQLYMDLIVGEEAEKIKKAGEAEAKKCKKKKRKDKNKEKKNERAEKEKKKMEKREQEEKERKEQDRKVQEQLKYEKELRKAVASMVIDIISQAESVISQKKSQSMESDIQAKRKKNVKKKKPKRQNENQKANNTTNGKERLKIKDGKENVLIGRERDMPREMSPVVVRCVAPRRDELVVRLHQEIEDYVTYTKLIIEANYSPRAEAMITRIDKIVTSIWHSAYVRVYGSYATSLVIPSSDLDLVVMGASSSMPGQALRILANALRTSSSIQSLNVIETARVPIIKLSTHPESLPTDIAVNDEFNSTTYCSSEGLAQHSGIAACELVKGYIRKMPYLTPMVLVLKQYLYERGLNNTFTGGINSFLLILMTISFLQLYGSSEKAGANPKKRNLGLLLIEFLDYYGKKFDYDTMGISIMNGGSHFLLKDACFRYPIAPMVIIDPFNPVHNIAQGAYGISRVRSAFADGHNAIVGLIDSGIKPANLLNRIILQDQDFMKRKEPPKPAVTTPPKTQAPPGFKGVATPSRRVVPPTASATSVRR